MEICAFCKKQYVIKTILAITNLKSKEIEHDLHLSKNIVSRHLSGEKPRTEIDIYIIEKLLGIKIKDYTIIDD